MLTPLELDPVPIDLLGSSSCCCLRGLRRVAIAVLVVRVLEREGKFVAATTTNTQASACRLSSDLEAELDSPPRPHPRAARSYQHRSPTDRARRSLVLLGDFLHPSCVPKAQSGQLQALSVPFARSRRLTLVVPRVGHPRSLRLRLQLRPRDRNPPRIRLLLLLENKGGDGLGARGFERTSANEKREGRGGVSLNGSDGRGRGGTDEFETQLPMDSA